MSLERKRVLATPKNPQSQGSTKSMHRSCNVLRSALVRFMMDVNQEHKHKPWFHHLSVFARTPRGFRTELYGWVVSERMSLPVFYGLPSRVWSMS